MKTLTTIQVTSEEDKEIALLKDKLGLPTKKAVVMEGLKALRKILQDQMRRKRLQAASRLVRGGSNRINEEWSSLAFPIGKK